MGQARLAPDKKGAARQSASLVFLDESGLLMAPLVRRSWAPRGQTPLLYQRVRLHEKVSLIAALTVSPQRQRVGLYFSMRPDRNVDRFWTVEFLQSLRRHLRRPMVVIWDRLSVHRSRFVRDYAQRTRSIDLEHLPPYAPELNPVEYFFSYLKGHALANHAPLDTSGLAVTATDVIETLRPRQQLLRGFLRGSPLFCP